MRVSPVRWASTTSSTCQVFIAPMATRNPPILFASARGVSSAMLHPPPRPERDGNGRSGFPGLVDPAPLGPLFAVQFPHMRAVLVLADHVEKVTPGAVQAHGIGVHAVHRPSQLFTWLRSALSLVPFMASWSWWSTSVSFIKAGLSSAYSSTVRPAVLRAFASAPAASSALAIAVFCPTHAA